MMANTVHYLPLFWSEACDEVKVFEQRGTHMDEVVSDTSYRENQITAD